MSFGTKTNERPGTRAQVEYTRVSAYKAREVLDLIRDEPVARALEILEFAERDVARVILKCLESAIANAEHNDQIPADELYVSACFADEGPTLKRWRPRARGRATRIRKRTCHITIIVSRIAPEELERMRRARDRLRWARWRPGRRRGPPPAGAAQPPDQGREEGRRGRGRRRTITITTTRVTTTITTTTRRADGHRGRRGRRGRGTRPSDAAEADDRGRRADDTEAAGRRGDDAETTDEQADDDAPTDEDKDS